MSSPGPITQEEREYANAVRGHLPVAQIARNLGRSRPTVYKMFDEEPPADGVNGCGHPDAAPPPAGESSLDRLKWLRERLLASMLEADPKSIPALAREYRATIEAIERIEGDGGDDVSSAIGVIGAALAAKLSP